MTIKRGDAWGDLVALPDGVPVAADDATLAAILDDSTNDVAGVVVTGGDLARTMGRIERPAPRPGDEVRSFPIDLVDVRLDDGARHPAVAHVIAHRRWLGGGPWRGRVVAAMNAEFVGPCDVAPRGHPNDGRIEIFDVAATMSWRDRWQAWRRLPAGGHLPHPDIATRAVRATTLEFDRPLAVAIDGASAGSASRIELSVRRDAGIVYL
ncbi:MAG: hypothetical protein AAFY28_05170 [Actinomycetota bacterium]